MKQNWLEQEWQRYVRHFESRFDGNMDDIEDDKAKARHAFFMATLTTLLIVAKHPEKLLGIAEELDRFLAAGCACPECAAKQARGEGYSLVADLKGVIP